MTVLVLCPVLGRPERALPFAAQLRETSSAELLFLANRRDEQQIAACLEAAQHVVGVGLSVVPWDAGPGDYAKKINYGFATTTQTWVLQGADDLYFHPGWQEAALAVYWHTRKRVIGTNDLCNPMTIRGRHSTHTLLARSYIDEYGGGWDGPGIVLHEGYDHQYVDNELVTAAKQRREWAPASECIIQHLHPLCGHARDATYEKAMRKGREDGKLYNERLRASTGGS